MDDGYTPTRHVNCIHFKSGGCRAVPATLWFGLARCVYKDDRAAGCNLQHKNEAPKGPVVPMPPPARRVRDDGGL